MIETQDLRGLLARVSADLPRVADSLHDSVRAAVDSFRSILDERQIAVDENPTPIEAGNETSPASESGKDSPAETAIPSRPIETFWTDKRAELEKEYGMHPPRDARDTETGLTYAQIVRLARKENARNEASPAGLAQMDFAAFFANNSVGHSEPFAGGTVTLVSPVQMVYTDPTGKEHTYHRNDPVLRIARENPYLAAEWEQMYGLRPLESPVGRYYMDGSAFIPSPLARVEGTGQFNAANREILRYILPNGVEQFIDPESSLGRLQPYGLIGHGMADPVFLADGDRSSLASYGRARFMEEIGNQAIAAYEPNPNTTRYRGTGSVEELA